VYFRHSAICVFARTGAQSGTKGNVSSHENVVGLWGFSGDMERALLRFRPAPPDKFVKSLAEALEYLGVPDTTFKP
jgi:hypothetical protein